METYYDEMSTTDTESTETTAVATDETKEIAKSSAPKTGRMAWAVAHKGFIEILAPELRAQLSYYRKRDKQMTQNALQEEVAI